MKTYTVDDFTCPKTDEELETLKDIIDKKISLLYDFAILTKGNPKCKDHKRKLITILASYGTEVKMTTALYDVLNGKETIDDFIERKKAIIG